MDTYVITYPNGITTEISADKLVALKPSLLLADADWKRKEEPKK